MSSSLGTREGDDTREWWLTAHRQYFARRTAREGFDLEGNPLAVFDRFEIVWPLDFAMKVSPDR